jgi:hypothetical protein
LRQCLRHGGATTGQALDGTQVETFEIGLAHEVDHHRRYGNPEPNAITLDQKRGTPAVPSRHHHHGRTERDRYIHGLLHASDMEHRHRA